MKIGKRYDSCFLSENGHVDGLARTGQRGDFCYSRNSKVDKDPSLFPTFGPLSKALFEKASAYKDGPILNDDMQKAMEWMLAARNSNSVVVALDGRSKAIRRKFEECVEAAVTDHSRHYEGSITFRVPASGDIRFPRRKTFAAFRNIQFLVGALPCPKVRMKTQARGHFSACGETSTYAASYSDVAIRSLKSLPKSTLNDKQSMTKCDSPELPEEVVEALGRSGYPLFWTEFLDAEWFRAFYKDMNINHVFDLTPGTTAAACAAAINGIVYEGIAMNESHANFLNNIMDKAVFAILAASEAESDKAVRENLQKYFLPLIEEGREYIVSKPMEEDEDDAGEIDGEDAAQDED